MAAAEAVRGLPRGLGACRRTRRRRRSGRASAPAASPRSRACARRSRRARGRARSSGTSSPTSVNSTSRRAAAEPSAMHHGHSAPSRLVVGREHRPDVDEAVERGRRALHGACEAHDRAGLARVRVVRELRERRRRARAARRARPVSASGATGPRAIVTCVIYGGSRRSAARSVGARRGGAARRARARARSPCGRGSRAPARGRAGSPAGPGSGARAARRRPRARRGRRRRRRRARRGCRARSTPSSRQPALDPLRAPAVQVAPVLGEAPRERGVVDVAALEQRARRPPRRAPGRPACAEVAPDLGLRAVAVARGSARRRRTPPGARQLVGRAGRGLPGGEAAGRGRVRVAGLVRRDVARRRPPGPRRPPGRPRSAPRGPG